RLDSGEAVIVSVNRSGNICEVKYHTGNPAVIEQAVLQQQDGQWFVSFNQTAGLREKLQQECAGKLQQLGKALQSFSQLKQGRFPGGNDSAGWEELLSQKLIKSAGDYHCPYCNKAYNYMGGKNVDSRSDSPLAWCDKHFENDNLSNVLLVDGTIKAMPSPAAYVPTAAVTPAPAAVRRSSGAVAAVALTEQEKTPAGWEKGHDDTWYVHYDEALKAAKRENKNILLLHTGSDWCIWCKRLAQDVLSQDDFKKFAGDKFILLYFDSPSPNHPMKPEQRQHVKAVEKQLGISGGYPMTFILDTNGKILGEIAGYRNLESYISALAPYSYMRTANTPQTTQNNWLTSDKRTNYPLVRNSAADSNPAQPAKKAAPKHWLPGPTPDWYIHLDDAVAAAKRTGRKIYALHTGSDWCPPCKNLEKNILSTAKFKKFAKENLILLFVDAPRRKPIPKDQQDYNRKLASKLKFGGGVPSILLLDSDGKPLGRLGGRSNTTTHIKAIKKALEMFK
ncbi:MAG: thioredoxin family protein, partial [Lentisphaeria bacterium]|nr:thioredoxin family protein [Lentisphaeria bacterium]